jgi:3-hydroxy-9,10-secoandrosta-1,3,5(10)-triene-9,17-dione monooxygenase reductase component
VSEVITAEADGVEPQLFRDVMGRFATGITIVAAIEDEIPVGFTCQSFVSLSLQPPLVAICPAKTSTSWPKMAAAGRFSVNVLADDQEAICYGFAKVGGDKFAHVDWRPGPYGAPLIAGSVAAIECAIELIHSAGDHEFVIGRVLSLEATEKEPLLYYRSQLAWLRESTDA